MALFGGDRDAALITTLNRELLNNIVDTTIDIYKLSLYDTKANLYGEAINKIYKPGVRVASLIAHDDQAWSSDEFGPDMNQGATFNFLKYELESVANVVLEVGDVIAWDTRYWEIDSLIENQYFVGKNEKTTAKVDQGIGQVVVELSDEFSSPFTVGEIQQEVYGQSISIVAVTHQSRRSKLKIEKIRSGIERTTKGLGVRGI